MGILDSVFGGGNAWLEEGWGGQQAVVDHARQLGYPGTIAPAGSDKRTWTTFTDAFNAWKARKGYLDTAAPAQEEMGQPVAGTNDAYYGNPIRQNNPYFPMLYEAFTPPPMQDWSGMPGFENSIFADEYYQPWADKYPGSQWTPYEPPVFNTPIEYMSPLFALEVMFEEEEEEGGSDGNKGSDGTDLDDRGRPDRPGSDGLLGGRDPDGRSSADLGIGMGGGYDHKGWDGTSAQTTGLGPSVGVSPSESYGYGQHTGFDKFGSVFDGVSDDATYP